MKARCPKDGLFMKYKGRYWSWAGTAPQGSFACHRGHEQVLTLPWKMILWPR